MSSMRCQNFETKIPKLSLDHLLKQAAEFTHLIHEVNSSLSMHDQAGHNILQKKRWKHLAWHNRLVHFQQQLILKACMDI